MKMKSFFALFLSLALALQPAYGALSPNKSYNLQSTGSNVNTWGIVLNSNFSNIDSNFGGRLNNNVAGSANVTVSSSQAQNLMHVLTGVLTGNINYTFPASGGMYFVTNNTTGSFTVTAAISGGSGGVLVPQGSSALVFANPDVPNVLSLTAPVTQFFVGGTTTGSSNAQVLATVNPTGYTLTQGYLTTWRAGFSNNSSVTFNENGLGAIPMEKSTQTGLQNLVNGDIIQNSDYASVYDATAGAMVLLNPTSASIGAATTTTLGLVSTDGVTLSNSAGAIAVEPATTTTLGAVKTDGSTISNASGAISCTTATSSQIGCVQPDGVILTISGGNVTAAKATAGSFGVVEVDGTSITASAGVISARQPIMTPLGTGSIVMAAHSGAVGIGGVVAGSSLTVESGNGTGTGDSLSGNWQCLMTDIGLSEVILWQRVN